MNTILEKPVTVVNEKLKENGLYIVRKNDNKKFFVSFSFMDFSIWEELWKQNVTMDDVADTRKFLGYDAKGNEIWSVPVDHLFQYNRNRVMGLHINF